MGRIHFKLSMNYGLHCTGFHKAHNVLRTVNMDFQYRVLHKSIKKYLMEITGRNLLRRNYSMKFHKIQYCLAAQRVDLQS